MKADIGINQQAPGSITFQVQVDSNKRNEAYRLWVANKCSEDGELVSVEYLPVRYPDGGTTPDEGVAGPFTIRGTTANAYVFTHPNTQTPMRGATIDYQP